MSKVTWRHFSQWETTLRPMSLFFSPPTRWLKATQCCFQDVWANWSRLTNDFRQISDMWVEYKHRNIQVWPIPQNVCREWNTVFNSVTCTVHVWSTPYVWLICVLSAVLSFTRPSRKTAAASQFDWCLLCLRTSRRDSSPSPLHPSSQKMRIPSTTEWSAFSALQEIRLISVRSNQLSVTSATREKSCGRLGNVKNSILQVKISMADSVER